MGLEREVEIIEDWTPEDVKYLEERVVEHNASMTGVQESDDLTILLRMRGRKEITAGVSGWTWGSACEIRYLWVHPRERRKGLGRRLMQEAEQEACSRGCETIILETYDAQAVAFYQKLGYDVFAIAENYPRGHAKWYMRKKLSIGSFRKDSRGEGDA